MSFITNYPTLTGLAPVFQWAEVGNVADDIIVLKYGKNPDPDFVPDELDFSVDGTLETITNVDIVGDTIRLTMSDSLLSTDDLTVSYIKGTNPIQDTSGHESLDLTDREVINNIE